MKTGQIIAIIIGIIAIIGMIYFLIEKQRNLTNTNTGNVCYAIVSGGTNGSMVQMPGTMINGKCTYTGPNLP